MNLPLNDRTDSYRGGADRNVFDQALKQLVGTTIQPPAGTPGPFIVTIEDARVRRCIGLTGVALDLASVTNRLHSLRNGIGASSGTSRLPERFITSDASVTKSLLR